jgi:chromosome segregation ATPase
MAAPESPQSREFRQMRHDVDDVYRLLTETNELAQSSREAIGAVWNGQRRHGTRLEEIQQALDLQNMRTDRMEDTQRTQGDRLGRVEGHLGDINRRLESVDQRFDGLDQRFDGVDQRFDGLDGRLERMEDTQQQILALLRGPAES